MFRSRINGHRYVSLSRFAASIGFASVVPSFIAVVLVMLVFILGIFETGDETFVSAFTGVAMIAMVAAAYAAIAIFFIAPVGLLFLRFGYGGWAVPVFLGGLIAGSIGHFALSNTMWALFGAAHGLALWWGLALFSPESLREQT